MRMVECVLVMVVIQLQEVSLCYLFNLAYSASWNYLREHFLYCFSCMSHCLYTYLLFSAVITCILPC